MYVVALTELAGDLETEAPFFASLLRLAPYDVKVRLAGAMPKVLVSTPDEPTAADVVRQVQSRHHRAMVYDASRAVHAAHMVKLHRFSLDATGVWANGQAGDRLAWADLGAVILALVRTSVSKTTEESEYMSSMTAHSINQMRVTHQVTRTQTATTHVAYLFPNALAASPRPWLLEEATAQFVGLGRDMQPTRHGNFFATIAAMRRYAPNAVFDDRFVASPIISHGTVHLHGQATAPPQPPPALADLTVNILAATLSRDRGGPYR
jgi:hypothetical protein